MDDDDIINRLLPEMTLAEIAEEFGVSPERVRQIQAQALGKLRLDCRRNGMRAADHLEVHRDDED